MAGIDIVFGANSFIMPLYLVLPLQSIVT